MKGIVDRSGPKYLFGLLVLPLALSATLPEAHDTLGTDSRKFPQVVQNFIAVWNSRDAGAVDRVFAPDVVLQNVPEESVYKGRDAVKEYISDFLLWAPDLNMTVTDYHVEAQWGVVEWTWSCTLHGDFSTELNISGKSFSVAGASIVRLTGGQVTHCTNYYDAATLLHQLDGRVIFLSSEPPL